MAITKKAPARINLGLDIIGKRPDGYHDLSTTMVSIDSNDYITVSETDGSEIVVESSNHKILLNDKNDVFKAAKLIRETCQIDSGVKIELKKPIPIYAGLSGGSTDAAAIIRALDKLWQLNLSKDETIDVGSQIGSDVPYCLEAGCACVSGKGEIVECFDYQLSAWIVLVKPEFDVSAHTVFPEIDCKTISRVDIVSLREVVLAKDYEKMVAYMGNSLEDITIKCKPSIQKIKDRMINCGADVALMTGSGSTVYVLCCSEKKAGRLVSSMRGLCKEVYEVRILQRKESNY